MARTTFGGTLADFIATRTSGAWRNAGPVTITIWDSRSGGEQLTDLLLDGQAVTSIRVGSEGQVPAFQGPDGLQEVWAQVEGGTRRWRFTNGPEGPQGEPGAAGGSDAETAQRIQSGPLTQAALSAADGPVFGVAQTAAAAAIAADTTKVAVTEKAAGNGVASLDALRTIPADQLPVLVREFSGNRIPDLILEVWHNKPTYQGAPWRRTWFGGSSSTGLLIAGYYDHDSKRGWYAAIATTVGGPDDHKSVVTLAPTTRPALCMWTNHNLTTKLHSRKGRQLGTLELGPETTVEMGGNTSYLYLFRTNSNSLLALCRVDNYRWRFVRSTNYGTTWDQHPPRTLLEKGGSQVYMVIRSNSSGVYDDAFRFAAYGHPVIGDWNTIYAGTISNSGSVRALGGATLGNLDGTGLPIDPTALRVVYAPPAGKKARLFDIQGNSNGTTSDPDITGGVWDHTNGVATSDVTYKLWCWNAATSTYVENTIPVPAGSTFGYLPDSKYVGGVFFAHPGTNTIYASTLDTAAGKWKIVRFAYTKNAAGVATFSAPTVVAESASSAEPLIRPFPVDNAPAGAEVLFSAVKHYAADVTGDNNFYADTHMAGFPG